LLEQQAAHDRLVDQSKDRDTSIAYNTTQLDDRHYNIRIATQRMEAIEGPALFRNANDQISRAGVQEGHDVTYKVVRAGSIDNILALDVTPLPFDHLFLRSPPRGCRSLILSNAAGFAYGVQ